MADCNSRFINGINKAAIIGLGLIGGSLGLAMLQGGLVKEVTGFDDNNNAINKALEIGSINKPASSLQEAVKDADLVILSVPVGALKKVAESISTSLKPGAIVTDTGSVKGPVVKELEASFHSRVHYVGGHPMAGSERTGILAADRYLLENAVYILTPTINTDSTAMKRLTSLFQSMGARVMNISPDVHDLVIAGVSHLPHLLAVTLVKTAGELAQEYPQTLMLAAGGFRDTTRVAGGEPVMWRDIFIYNKNAILSLLSVWRNQVDIIENLIIEGNQSGMEDMLKQARFLREQVPARKKGLLPALHEIVVTVPDKPGIIGVIGTILGQNGINITDIEILRVREGEGGSIRLGFTSSAFALKAVEILQKEGFTARML